MWARRHWKQDSLYVLLPCIWRYKRRMFSQTSCFLCSTSFVSDCICRLSCEKNTMIFATITAPFRRLVNPRGRSNLMHDSKKSYPVPWLPQVEATPPEELTFSWLKNGRALRSSERMVITQTDPDISPGTTNLDIIDLKFTDFGTYTCVAALKGGGIPEISIDVNISSTTGESHTPACQWRIYTPPPTHTAHWHVLAASVSHEGFRGFWEGFLPSKQRNENTVAVFLGQGGLRFCIFRHFCQLCYRFTEQQSPNSELDAYKSHGSSDHS